MVRARVILHVVTAATVIVGVAVAVTTSGQAGGAARAATIAAPPAPLLFAAPTTVSTPAPTWPPPTTVAAAPVATAASPAPPTAPPTTAAAPLASVSVAGWRPQLVARIKTAAISLYALPGAKAPATVVSATTWFGTRYVLPVLQLGGDWLKVLLPVGLGNDHAGWIRAADATLDHVDDSVSVDLAAHRLVWVHAGVVQLDVSVAVGALATPTPQGSFFVTDIVPEHAPGPYGAWAIAINAVSEAMSTFEGGLPQIAIHGTDDPGSIGRSVSSGCVRVDAAALDQLARGLPVGTPVVIR